MEASQTCSRCKKTISLDDFPLKKSGTPYKTCKNCRMKEENNRRTEESNVDIVEDEKKRENRPKISQQKQYIVLQEQGFKCRGPGKNDNKYYECEMNVNKKRFCDKKSSQPQFDHISRWKEGGNSLKNIQALCANCHLMKTTMENVMNEDKECPSERVIAILKSLSKPKYIDVLNGTDDSSDDSDIDDIIVSRKLRKVYR